MSFTRTPLEILAGGIAQAEANNCPADMIARLKGAHAFCEQTTRNPDNSPSAAIIVERVPQLAAQDE